MKEQISLINTLSSWKIKNQRNWYDELLRSFGAYYLFNHVFIRDSRLLHGFSELTDKSFSRLKKELKEQSIVAEEVLSINRNAPSPLTVFENFKNTIFMELDSDLKRKTGRCLTNPITSRKE